MLPVLAAFHDQSHHAANAAMAALDVASRDAYELEDLTPGEQLPAGPETAPWIMVGGSHARDYPNARISRIIDRALGARGGLYTAWVSQIVGVLPQLAVYEPLGEMMLDVVMAACVKGEARQRRGEGWRHVGEGQKLAKALCGGEEQLLGLLADAWGIIGVVAGGPG